MWISQKELEKLIDKICPEQSNSKFGIRKAVKNDCNKKQFVAVENIEAGETVVLCEVVIDDHYFTSSREN